jgi:hypothetical protein
MSTLTKLKQGLLTARCEVCGSKATVAVNEIEERAPIAVNNPETAMKELWAQHAVRETHYFCAAHERSHPVKPWVPPEGWAP